MTTVYYYRIYCNTEDKWKYVWGETEPVVCPNISEHTINPNSTFLSSIVSEKTFSLKEEQIPTGGHYGVHGECLNVTEINGNLSIKETLFHYPINLLSIKMCANESNIGDVIEGIVAPNTTIGAITTHLAVNDTIAYVTNTVTDNIKIGYIVYFTDGVNSSCGGSISAINRSNGSITYSCPLVNAYSATSPTYVQMGIKMMSSITIGATGIYEFGLSAIGGSYIPEQTVGRIIYKNNSQIPKQFSYHFDYLY
jgi:hypothetical protein